MQRREKFFIVWKVGNLVEKYKDFIIILLMFSDKVS